MRLDVFNRDGFACCKCGDKKSTLNAHHVHYHPLAEGPWDYDSRTIITLCATCHEGEHSDLDNAKASVLLAIAAMGYTTAHELECLCDVLGALDRETLTRLFLERSNGKNQNN